MIEQLETIDFCLKNYFETITYLTKKIDNFDGTSTELSVCKKILNMLTGGYLITTNEIARNALEQLEKLKEGKENDN